MVSESDSAGFDLLREIAAGGVRNTSLRNVARQLGMSPSGLSKVLGGSRSQAATRRRLERWIVWNRARGGEPRVPPAEYAARVLVHGLPSRRQPHALSLLAETLARSFSEAGVDVPDWLAQLRAADEDDAPPSE